MNKTRCSNVLCFDIDLYNHRFFFYIKFNINQTWREEKQIFVLIWWSQKKNEIGVFKYNTYVICHMWWYCRHSKITNSGISRRSWNSLSNSICCKGSFLSYVDPFTWYDGLPIFFFSEDLNHFRFFPRVFFSEIFLCGNYRYIVGPATVQKARGFFFSSRKPPTVVRETTDIACPPSCRPSRQTVE